MLLSGVARGEKNLCDYDLQHEGKFDRSIISSPLKSIPQNITKITLPVNDQNTIVMHVLVGEPFIYLCIADKCFSKKRAYQFLMEIKQQFCARDFYQRALTADAYEMRKEFYFTLKNEMHYFSNNQFKNNENSAGLFKFQCKRWPLLCCLAFSILLAAVIIMIIILLRMHA